MGKRVKWITNLFYFIHNLAIQNLTFNNNMSYLKTNLQLTSVQLIDVEAHCTYKAPRIIKIQISYN